MANEAWSVEAGDWGVKISQTDVQKLAARLLEVRRERDELIDAAQAVIDAALTLPSVAAMPKPLRSPVAQLALTIARSKGT